jgi:hypothetical protein
MTTRASRATAQTRLSDWNLSRQVNFSPVSGAHSGLAMMKMRMPIM